MTMDNNGVVYVLPYSKSVSPPITDQRLNSLQVSASHWNRTLKWPLLPFLLVQTTLPPIVRCILTSKARLTAQARDSRIWGSGPTDPFASSSLSYKTLDNTHAAFRLGDVVGITGKRVCKCVQHPHIMTSLSLSLYQISAKKRLASASFDCDLDAGVSVEVSI